MRGAVRDDDDLILKLFKTCYNSALESRERERESSIRHRRYRERERRVKSNNEEKEGELRWVSVCAALLPAHSIFRRRNKKTKNLKEKKQKQTNRL